MTKATDPSGEKPQPTGSLAARLERLFRVGRLKTGGAEYSSEEVADAIRRHGGPTISATYIYMLRKGIRDNPTKRHLEALADFFGVPPSYFFDEAAAAKVDAELELLAAIRASSARRIALRSADLPEEALRSIAEIVERVRRLEGLPSDEQPPELP